MEKGKSLFEGLDDKKIIKYYSNKAVTIEPVIINSDEEAINSIVDLAIRLADTSLHTRDSHFVTRKS